MFKVSDPLKQLVKLVREQAPNTMLIDKFKNLVDMSLAEEFLLVLLAALVEAAGVSAVKVMAKIPFGDVLDGNMLDTIKLSMLDSSETKIFHPYPSSSKTP